VAFSETRNQVDILSIRNVQVRHLCYPCYSLLIHPLLTFQVYQETSKVYVRGALGDHQRKQHIGDRSSLDCIVESKV
jgi:hypothetical protein